MRVMGSLVLLGMVLWIVILAVGYGIKTWIESL